MDVTCCIHRRGHAGCQKEKRHQRAGKNNPYQAFLVHLINFLNLCISVNVNLNLKNVWRKSQAILARSIKFPDIFFGSSQGAKIRPDSTCHIRLTTAAASSVEPVLSMCFFGL